MLDSAPLQAWRRRAQREGGERRRPSVKQALAAAGAGVLVFALLGGHSVKRERAAPAAAPATTADVPPCAAVTSGLHADVDGDGCDEGVAFADGVLTAGSVRMRLGAPGDQVA